MEPNEIQVDQVYFNYGPNFPRKVLKIENNVVISVDVSYGHSFYVCPLTTQYSNTIEEFSKWAQLCLTIADIKKKDLPLIPLVYSKDRNKNKIPK